MKNEFGEEISEVEIEILSKKIRKLTKEQIDTLWSLCGWVDNDKKENKSLSTKKINRMLKDGHYCEDMVKILLLETPKKEFLTHLTKITRS